MTNCETLRESTCGFCPGAEIMMAFLLSLFARERGIDASRWTDERLYGHLGILGFLCLLDSTVVVVVVWYAGDKSGGSLRGSWHCPLFLILM